MSLFVQVTAFALGLVSVTACSWQQQEKGCQKGPGFVKNALSGHLLPDKTLSVSFSGGPSDATREIADYLYAQEIRGAFFVRGINAASDSSSLSLIKERGHIVANGGFSGRRLTKVPDPITELRKTDELITPYIVGNMFLARFPENEFTSDLIDELNEAGLGKYVGPVHWDIGDNKENIPASGQDPAHGTGENVEFLNDASCWSRGVGVASCATGYLEHARASKKGIILLHDEDMRTVELLKELIPTLKAEGFSFVGLDEIGDIKLGLEAAGALPGTTGGAGGCNDYE